MAKGPSGLHQEQFLSPPKSIPAHTALGFEGKKVVLKVMMQVLGQAPGAQHKVIPHL